MPAKNRAKQSHRFKKFALLVLFAGALGAAASFWFLDQRVKRFIEYGKSPRLAAIYGAPVSLASLSALPVPEISQILKKRGYRETLALPQQPLEFQVDQEVSKLNLYRAAFLDPFGRSIPAERISISLQSKAEISPASAVPFLEPERLTYLSSSEIKTREKIAFEQLTPSLVNAVIAIEDERFFSHPGIDPVGILRAALVNFRAGRVVQGGSTITQQLAKNLFFTPERSIQRKVVEALAALSLELRLSKMEILELYLNSVFFGQEGNVALHGVESASRSFFRKSAGELSLSESALLAGLIQAPSAYSPRRNQERSKQRRDQVLGKLLELEMIDSSSFEGAKKAQIEVYPPSTYKRQASYFIDAVRASLPEEVNLEALIVSGAQLHTGLVPHLQSCGERAIEKLLPELEQRTGARAGSLQAALVALEPHSGLVRAWIGGRDYRKSQFDRVSLAQRQIGSTIKPFLYLTALDPRLNSYRVGHARSILSDRPLRVSLPGQPEWNPQNFDNQFRGDVTLRYALEQSLNVPAIYVLQRIGVPAFVSTIKNFRLAESPPAVLSLALGTLETNLLRLTAAFGALANEGIYTSPRLYRSAVTPEGEPIISAAFEERSVAGRGATFLVTDLLRGVMNRGTGSAALSISGLSNAAGKTGTSDDRRDAWFVGYVPGLVVGVWVGFDDNTPTKLTGGSAAAPIWGEFMKCGGPFVPRDQFLPPDEVVFIEIDATTGQRAAPSCPPENIVRELFLGGYEPRVSCSLHTRDELPEWNDERYERRDNKKQRPHRREQSFWERLFG